MDKSKLGIAVLFAFMAIVSLACVSGDATSERKTQGRSTECAAQAAATARSCCTGCGASYGAAGCDFRSQGQANCLVQCITDSPTPAGCD